LENWTISIYRNTFANNIADFGADLYIKNRINDNMDLNGISLANSEAITGGGSIYIYDEDDNRINYINFN